MSTKTLVWAGLFLGSSIGGYLPALFGQDVFSMWSVIGSTVGGIAGVYIGYKIGNELFY